VPQDVDAFQRLTGLVFPEVGLRVDEFGVTGPGLERPAGDGPHPGNGGVIEEPGQ